ncbi:MAG: four helix bundle suffix domain-containing protein [Alistipes sp.]|nr:four helix bundle suffix domain-containing protein [Alistipes sp.]
MPNIVPNKNNYKALLSYQKAESIYDITFFFTNNFLEKGDRTIDQMLQAARSGKQNIVEGYGAGATSKESELRLMSVAKNSLKELLCDYEDYLRVRNFRQWELGSNEFVKAQQLGKEHNESAFWRDLIKTRSAETVANLAIILLNQCDYLLYRYIQKISERFLSEGGFREKLNQDRRTHRYKK